MRTFLLKIVLLFLVLLQVKGNLLPYADVDSSLKNLAGAAEGFGAGTIGGRLGDVYHVTTLADHGPGSLRYACGVKQPLWIVFDVSGTISLSSAIKVTSFKTIDGRGQKIRITNYGLYIRSAEHVIVNNLIFEDGNVDAITIIEGTKNVWVDRCSFSNYTDGLVDITRQSSKVTVSRCYFEHHNKTILVSASPRHIEDRSMEVTIHHNFFNQTKERHPRVRFAKVHLYNNYMKKWGLYGVRVSVDAQIVSQNNVYEAGKSKTSFDYFAEKALDSDKKSYGSLSSEGDLFLNGAVKDVRASQPLFRPEDYYSVWTMQSADEELASVVSHIAGWQALRLPGQ